MYVHNRNIRVEYYYRIMCARRICTTERGRGFKGNEGVCDPHNLRKKKKLSFIVVYIIVFFFFKALNPTMPVKLEYVFENHKKKKKNIIVFLFCPSLVLTLVQFNILNLFDFQYDALFDLKHYGKQFEKL